MWPRLWPGWRVAAIWVTGLAASAITGAALFIFSGVYHVGASTGHFPATRWLLEIAMRRAVAAHSPEAARRPLDDPGLIRLGAGHFASGCAFCHGAPGEPRGPVVRGMLPTPPTLSEAAATWSAEELFWIVKNGLKYTGMPAWPAQERGDEVWAMVAFLRALPDMSPEAYRRLIDADIAPDAPPETEMCASCHGDGSDPPVHAIVPRLAGQSPAYLSRALAEYARGTRPSGFMQPVASRLSPGQVESLVAYYGSSRMTAGSDPDGAGAQAIARGRRIATEGLSERGVPPCLACHSGSASPAFPILHGQAAPHLMQQLRLFRDGVRDRTTYGAIMSVIARRLEDRDARDVALYFESLSEPSVGETMRPRLPEGRR